MRIRPPSHLIQLRSPRRRHNGRKPILLEMPGILLYSFHAKEDRDGGQEYEAAVDEPEIADAVVEDVEVAGFFAGPKGAGREGSGLHGGESGPGYDH